MSLMIQFKRQLRKLLILTELIFISLLASRAEGAFQAVDTPHYGNDWRIEHAGKIPYLVQNGIPAFGRFSSDRPRYALNGTWEFSNLGAAHPPLKGWEPIEVPGVWNYLRPDLLDYVGPAWYQKTFIPPENFKGQTVRLYFGGVNMRCRVWLNGTELGGHEGGYTPFAFDVTDLLDYESSNLLLLNVDNRMTYTSVPPLNYEGSRMGWWEYGGIHREVYLEAAPELTTFKLVVRTTPQNNGRWAITATALFWDRRENPGPEDVDIKARVIDESSVDSGDMGIELRPAETLKGQDGVWGITFAGDMENPKLWSPESPNASYTFKVSINYGSASETSKTYFGFRKFESRADGLFLNGKPYYIRGINRHEDDPATGLVDTEAIIRRDIALMKEMRVNHMRPGHYPNDPKLFDVTDREGIGITEEIPLYQAGLGFSIWARDRFQRRQKVGAPSLGNSGPGQFTNQQLVRNATLALIEMLERDINHPSILAWSIGNENFTFSGQSRRTYQTLKDVAKTFDPDRPVTFALLTIPVVSVKRESTADIADFISINEYFGWYHGEVSEVGPYLEEMHKRFPGRVIVVSEFGAEGVMDLSKVRTGRKDGQGTFHPDDQARIIAEQWKILRSLDFVRGGMPWVFADFRCGWFKEEAPTPYFNTKGVLTYDRARKPAFFTLRDIYTEF